MKINAIFTAETIEKFLDKQPADEVHTGHGLAALMGVSRDMVGRRMGALAPAYYHQKSSNLCYFGNPKAIAALKKVSRAQ